MEGVSFWHFAVSCYGRQGVETACLTLQDDHQLNVMLVLYCLWAGIYRGELTSENLKDLNGLVTDWDSHVVAPLRAVRRWLKHFPDEQDTGIEAFRLTIRDNELRGEELLARQLEHHLTSNGEMVGNADWEAACRQNLDRYARLHNLQTEGATDGLFSTLIQAAGITAAL